MNDVQRAAEQYLARHLPLVGIKPVGGKPVKEPTTSGWADFPLEDTSCITDNWNIGLLLTTLTDIDVDLPGLGMIAKRRLPVTKFSWGRKWMAGETTA